MQRRGYHRLATGGGLLLLGFLLSLPCSVAGKTREAKRAAQAIPEDAAVLLARALPHFKAQRYAQALPLLEAAHAARPQDLAVLLLLGVTYARLGHTERAAPLLQTVALGAEPEDQAAARIFLGIIYRDQGASDRAQQELNKAATQAPSLGSSVHGLLQGIQPNLISGAVIIASEFDGNVPLTSLPSWRASPSSSGDGDFLFIGALTVRPSRRIGFYLNNTSSYRQQLQLQDYNLLLNTTTVGYGYFGVRHRVRLAAAFTPALLGGQLLYLDAAWHAAYRINIVQKLGVAISYDGRYRDYWRPEYEAFTGASHTAQAELSWGVLPDPVSAGVGFQVVRDALAARPPSAGTDGCLISDDFRAWAFGPTARLRVRLHQRVELALVAALLRRRFDYILPSGEQRFDWEVSADLSLNVQTTRWLDVFVGSLHTHNGSTDENYSYYKPNIYLGVYGHFAAY